MTHTQPVRRDVLKTALAGMAGLATSGATAAKSASALPASGKAAVARPPVVGERYLPDVIMQRELEAALALDSAAECAVASFFHRMFRGATIEPGELTIGAQPRDYDKKPGWPSGVGGFNVNLTQDGENDPEVWIGTTHGDPVYAPPGRFVRDLITQEELESLQEAKEAVSAIETGIVNRIQRGAAIEPGPLAVSPNSWREVGPSSALTIHDTGAPQSSGTVLAPAPATPRKA